MTPLQVHIRHRMRTQEMFIRQDTLTGHYTLHHKNGSLQQNLRHDTAHTVLDCPGAYTSHRDADTIYFKIKEV